jgi:hypothetical protein
VDAVRAARPERTRPLHHRPPPIVRSNDAYAGARGVAWLVLDRCPSLVPRSDRDELGMR